ncbi:MAG TPA: hypothetical protein VKE98_05665 [Gemmataceae bacterium]|nr:hypothetical protein [Gemmataceae bacterium]
MDNWGWFIIWSFLLGLFVGKWVGRFSSLSLNDLDLPDSQKRQIERAVENHTFDSFWPMILVWTLITPVMLVLIVVTTGLAQFVGQTALFGLLLFSGIFGSAKQKKVLLDAIRQIRANSFSSGGSTV